MQPKLPSFASVMLALPARQIGGVVGRTWLSLRNSMHEWMEIIISDIFLKKPGSDIFTFNKTRLIEHKINFLESQTTPLPNAEHLTER